MVTLDRRQEHGWRRNNGIMDGIMEDSQMPLHRKY